MARLNVYLPDELAAQAKDAGLNVSAVTQQAIKASLAARSTDSWLCSLSPAPPAPVTHERALDALDAARDEVPSRHG